MELAGEGLTEHQRVVPADWAGAEQARQSGREQTARVLDSATYLAENLERVPVHVIPCLKGRLNTKELMRLHGMRPYSHGIRYQMKFAAISSHKSRLLVVIQ